MRRNYNDFEVLERDDIRGFEILGRERETGWEIEVCFDNEAEPRRPSGRTPETRDEAITTGREVAKMGG